MINIKVQKKKICDFAILVSKGIEIAKSFGFNY
jgi:hypothetical protein